MDFIENDVVMDLPQTDAGVPAPGIDPTVAELGDLNSIASIFDWLGTPPGARAALVVALGGGRAPVARHRVHQGR